MLAAQYVREWCFFREWNKKGVSRRRRVQELICLQVLSKPTDSFSVSLSLKNRAHEHFHRPRSHFVAGNVSLSGAHMLNVELPLELILTQCSWLVNLVSENKHWNGSDLLVLEQRFELNTAFLHSFGVGHIDQEDDGVHGREVIFPDSSCLRVTTEIVCGKRNSSE